MQIGEKVAGVLYSIDLLIMETKSESKDVLKLPLSLVLTQQSILEMNWRLFSPKSITANSLHNLERNWPLVLLLSFVLISLSKLES